MTHTPRREMRLDFPAFLAEQIVFLIKHGNSLDFLDRAPEYPRTLSQDEMNSDVNSGMQNSSV